MEFYKPGTYHQVKEDLMNVTHLDNKRQLTAYKDIYNWQARETVLEDAVERYIVYLSEKMHAIDLEYLKSIRVVETIGVSDVYAILLVPNTDTMVSIPLLADKGKEKILNKKSVHFVQSTVIA